MDQALHWFCNVDNLIKSVSQHYKGGILILTLTFQMGKRRSGDIKYLIWELTDESGGMEIWTQAPLLQNPQVLQKRWGLWRDRFPASSPYLFSSAISAVLKRKVGSQLRSPAGPACLPGTETQGCQVGEAQGSYQIPDHSLWKQWEAEFKRSCWYDWLRQPLQNPPQSHTASLRSRGGYYRTARKRGRTWGQRQDPLVRERNRGRISLPAPTWGRGER